MNRRPLRRLKVARRVGEQERGLVAGGGLLRGAGEGRVGGAQGGGLRVEGGGVGERLCLRRKFYEL